MPKALSLKKVQLANHSKNQKPITQFFKNNSQLDKKFDDSSQNSKYGTLEVLPAKRKASSPLPFSTAESTLKIEDPFVSNNTKTSNQKTQSPLKSTCLNKKIKLETSPEKLKDCIFEKSPKKENKIKLTPDANKNADCILSCNNKSGETNRSPLTPVKLENVITCNGNKSSAEDVKDSKNGEDKTGIQSYSIVSKIDDEFHQSTTPTKSPNIGSTVQHSPGLGKLHVTHVVPKNELSPSKCGSTVRILDFNDHDIQDVFGDDWLINDNNENCSDELDLSTIKRCEILSVKHHSKPLELRLKDAANKTVTCFVEGIWLDTPLCTGDVVSIIATRNSLNQFHVSNTSGLLVLRPDYLLSSTSVVAGVFCKRKAILQERWRGIDSSNTAMTVGILIHELVQKALTQQIMDIAVLQSEANKIIEESIQRLYDAGLSEDEARSNIQIYISPLAQFMQTYVASGKPTVPAVQQIQKDKWMGHINKVLDIEENLCCPQLGMKGKIDATLQVTIHDRKGAQPEIVPLELKSGKVSMSAEHRGQLVLYGMMLSLQRREDPTQALQRGLLLYLKDRVDLREVSCGYPERRDLIMLRNQLVENLTTSPNDVDPEQLTDIEDASLLLQQRLPEPVHHEGACTKCPYLTICSLHLWHTDGPVVSDKHPLSKLQRLALGHLSPDHIKYFLHWSALLKMEEKVQTNMSPLYTLWTDTPDKRAKRGTCAPNLQLQSVQTSEDRYLHIFKRKAATANNKEETSIKGPQVGEFSIVSIENRPWIAAGVVMVSNETEIKILLERNLSLRLNKTTLFHIDIYESYATVVNNLSNLGVLMDNDDRALRLRKLIIDKEEPLFEKKLPREVGRLGTKLMRSLNIQQQRAVLKVLAATDYALLQGLPGTGKTQTISVLIQMLVALKQRVLVTAHTHSAVDTVLCRLPEHMKVMRLGSEARVAPQLVSRCERRLAAHCRTPMQLDALYNSMEVVGVTCLGAAHAMLARNMFDVCIVDEATQVVQSTVLRPLFAAKRFVLVGDPEQLPPVVKSRAARRLGMEESLFHRLMKEDVTSTLQLQYRMNQAIVNIANKVAYTDRLKCANVQVATANLTIDAQKMSQIPEWLVEACSTRADRAVVFLDVTAPADTAPCVNRSEACVVLALVNAMKEGGVQSTDIGVIAPYREQVNLLRRSLARYTVEASTVDQFQGRDKSVIIYSCTRNDVREDNSKVKESEILNDRRRLAVSVTRAKYKLLVVGNSRVLRRYAPLRELIAACANLPLSNETVAAVLHKYRALIT
ncbi:DNA replication ATP-dependent helicase/nuclease DNA2 [Achroia grisella]|uniref:DNA replication ATP-dependent helicase/nuclease DNA2 n=1 Tax=Achroia grisella TaxID=688607 RepID=UPI0027D2DED2|nr:DNA replication ATP-dependent helicase/nuclease DNA2 [Achroia grisella]